MVGGRKRNIVSAMTAPPSVLSHNRFQSQYSSELDETYGHFAELHSVQIYNH
jgi:hypothetical protein